MFYYCLTRCNARGLEQPWLPLSSKQVQTKPSGFLPACRQTKWLRESEGCVFHFLPALSNTEPNSQMQRFAIAEQDGWQINHKTNRGVIGISSWELIMWWGPVLGLWQEPQWLFGPFNNFFFSRLSIWGFSLYLVSLNKTADLLRLWPLGII